MDECPNEILIYSSVGTLCTTDRTIRDGVVWGRGPGPGWGLKADSPLEVLSVSGSPLRDPRAPRPAKKQNPDDHPHYGMVPTSLNPHLRPTGSRPDHRSDPRRPRRRRNRRRRRSFPNIPNLRSDRQPEPTRWRSHGGKRWTDDRTEPPGPDDEPPSPRPKKKPRRTWSH